MSMVGCMARQHDLVRGGFTFPTVKGPYQDNGASPWYCPMRLGSNPGGSILRVNFDTGARFIWVTSSECSTHACRMPGRSRFDARSSLSFDHIGSDLSIDFGPWGEMTARGGVDQIDLGGGSRLPVRFYQAVHYEGPQFEDLNWDGGIGLSNGLSADPLSSHLVVELLNQGLLAPEDAFVSFLMDEPKGLGSVGIGHFDSSKVDLASRVDVPFSPYVPGLDYIWTTALRHMRVGDVTVASDLMFCHDTGSSHFKGDAVVMMAAIDEVSQYRKRHLEFPTLELSFGFMHNNGRPAAFVLRPSEYVTQIEAGHARGRQSINLNPMPGLAGLVLAGSILLDHLCVLYRYEVHGSRGRYSVRPGTVEFYNKRHGPRVIQG